MLAILLEIKKDYNSALEAVQKGLSYYPKDANLLFEKGVILDKIGKKKECLETMRQVLKIDPKNADALNYIGYTYAEQGIRLDEAMELIKKALSIKPNSGYIVDSMGWIYYQKKLYKKAIIYLEKAVRLTPNDPTIMEHLGDAYEKQGFYKKALDAYQKALSLNPENSHKKRLLDKIEKIKKLTKK